MWNQMAGRWNNNTCLRTWRTKRRGICLNLDKVIRLTRSLCECVISFLHDPFQGSMILLLEVEMSHGLVEFAAVHYLSPIPVLLPYYKNRIQVFHMTWCNRIENVSLKLILNQWPQSLHGYFWMWWVVTPTKLVFYLSVSTSALPDRQHSPPNELRPTNL